jgi:hypothetical protein
MVAMALRYFGALVLIAAGISFLPPNAATIATPGGMVAPGLHVATVVRRVSLVVRTRASWDRRRR